MDGFKTHGDFETASKKFLEAKAVFSDERRVAFNDDAFERGDATGDGWVIFSWNGSRIEKATTVVELDVARWWEVFEGVVNLCWNRSCRHRFGQCALPEVAHQAAPGAFAISEEYGCDGDYLSLGRPLVFDEESIRPQPVERIAFRPTRENPHVTRGL